MIHTIRLAYSCVLEWISCEPFENGHTEEPKSSQALTTQLEHQVQP